MTRSPRTERSSRSAAVEGAAVDRSTASSVSIGVGRARVSDQGTPRISARLGGDADDPDATAVVPGQGGDEVEGTVGGRRPVDGQQDAHRHDLLRRIACAAREAHVTGRMARRFGC